MTTYTIPQIKNDSTDKTIAITKAEAKWIRANIPEVKLNLVGWLDRLESADVMVAVTQDLREVSGVTQSTRTRLRQRQLIHCQADPMSHAVSLQRWHLTPLLQEHLDETRANVLGADKFISIKLERTGTNWVIAPLYFNQFRRRLIELALTKPKTIKPPAPKPSPEWSFIPAKNL
jgi:hypothetical protein